MKRLPPHKVLWITYALFAAQIILLLIARLLTSVTAALAVIPLAVIMLVFHFLFYRCPRTVSVPAAERSWGIPAKAECRVHLPAQAAPKHTKHFVCFLVQILHKSLHFGLVICAIYTNTFLLYNVN